MPYPGMPSLLVPPTAPAAAPAVPSGTVSSAAPPTPVWGIYQNGQAVVQADSIVSFEYKAESRISDYPQEEGAFQSYNKVAAPFDARVMLAKGGTDADRASFLSAIDGIAQASNTNLYDVVTPEKTYTGASIQRYDYRRTAREGAKLIVVDVWLRQVRNGASATFTKTAAPSGQSKQNIGAVQPQTPTPAQSSRAGSVRSAPNTGGSTSDWSSSSGGATGIW